MTDLAQRTQIDPTSNGELSVSHDNDLLVVDQNVPVNIWVSLDQTFAPPVPRFSQSSDPNAPQFRGIKWIYDPDGDEMDYSLFITFLFQAPITELKCDTLWYAVALSNTEDPSYQQQQLCVRTGQATYHFDVYYTTGLRGTAKSVDPKIVVTPIVVTGGSDHRNVTA